MGCHSPPACAQCHSQVNHTLANLGADEENPFNSPAQKLVH